MTRMHPSPRRLRTLLRDTRAAALVEFAIIFPVLILLLFAMIDFGRAFFLRNNLVAAVREGARAAAVQMSPDPCSNDANIIAVTQAYVTNLGGAAPTVTVTPIGACGIGTTNIRVSITGYQFTPITPVFRLINYNTNLLLISVSATYRWESST